MELVILHKGVIVLDNVRRVDGSQQQHLIHCLCFLLQDGSVMITPTSQYYFTQCAPHPVHSWQTYISPQLPNGDGLDNIEFPILRTLSL